MLHAKPHTAEAVGPASMQHQLFPLVGSRTGSAAEAVGPLPELLSLCFKARVLFLAGTLTCGRSRPAGTQGASSIPDYIIFGNFLN
jgi:hypothetical protein